MGNISTFYTRNSYENKSLITFPGLYWEITPPTLLTYSKQHWCQTCGIISGHGFSLFFTGYWKILRERRSLWLVNRSANRQKWRVRHITD